MKLCYLTSEVLMKHLLQYIVLQKILKDLLPKLALPPIINAFNKRMQRESPTIHFLHQEFIV